MKFLYSFLCSLFMFLQVVVGGRLYAGEHNYQKVVILTTPTSSQDKEFLRNLKSILTTVKLHFTIYNLKTIKLKEVLSQLDKTNDLLLIAVSESDEINDFIALKKYILTGGRVMVPVWNSPNQDLLEISGVKKLLKNSTHYGFKNTVPVFPGLGKASSKSMLFSSSFFKVELEPTVKVLMRSLKGEPLIWMSTYGKGKCLVFNNNMLLGYIYSGLFLQFTSMTNDFFLYSLFNGKVIFIDDFPAPIPEGTEFSIVSNYDGRSYEEFYRDIWWPDLKKIGRKYGYKYTCLVLGNYENSVKLPLGDISPATLENIKYFAKDILANGDELGLHGYNHASLLTAKYRKELKEINYSPWRSIHDMEQGLLKLKKYLNELFGNIELFTYVPPMNMLAKPGKQAVLNAFPSIKCFAGLGDPSYHEPGVLHQTIGRDPDFSNVYDLPRFSSESTYSEEEMFSAFSHIASFGVFSHFIHPDDLLDPERSENKNWSELRGDIERICREISLACPYLRGMTAKEFVEDQFKTMSVEVYAKRQGNSIVITYSRQPEASLFHYLRINDGKTIKGVKNGKFQKVANAGDLYVIEGTASPVTILLNNK